MNKSNKKRYWLDQPRNINFIVYTLWAICAGLFVADLFYEKHAHFGWDGWFGFHAIFGFVAYCVIVLSAKGLRRFVKRDEDYYGDGLDKQDRQSDSLNDSSDNDKARHNHV